MQSQNTALLCCRVGTSDRYLTSFPTMMKLSFVVAMQLEVFYWPRIVMGSFLTHGPTSSTTTNIIEECSVRDYNVFSFGFCSSTILIDTFPPKFSPTSTQLQFLRISYPICRLFTAKPASCKQLPAKTEAPSSCHKLKSTILTPMHFDKRQTL